MKESMQNIYHQTVMDHYHNPRNKGVLPMPDFRSGSYNPSCGDAVCVQGTIHDNKITSVMFEGTGCVISQAGASLLMQKANGCSLQEIATFDALFMQSLLGMTLGPTRLGCALLPLQALHDGLKKYHQTKG